VILLKAAEEKALSTKRQITGIERGLSYKEAENRLKKYGLNILKGKRKISALKILMNQFTDFMVIILLACTAISMFMGEITESVTIIAIVIVNAILGFIQEFRTERTLDALKNLAAPMAKVIRGGEHVNIPAEKIVPGDLILLESGDRVPADATLIECHSLQVDESLLTGESHQVDKFAAPNPYSRHENLQSKHKVYMGTVITGGRGKAIVHSTGMETEMGKIAYMIQTIEEEETPLQKRLDHLGKLIVCGCLIICAVVTVTGILRGEELFTMLLAGISLAVAAVPEGLPAIVTIALALGVQKMLKRNALIRKLPAVETLGCASVICSDKTGTLTENKMTVRRIYAAGDMVEVKGGGSSKKGEFLINGKKIEPDKNYGLKLALEIGGICNDASIEEAKGSKHGFGKKTKIIFGGKDELKTEGDPTETALLVAAAKAGIDKEMLSEKYVRIDEIPFDSERKCMSVICSINGREGFVFTKGAPDMIIERCSRIQTSTGIERINAINKAGILRINDAMAADALRVLGVAYKKITLGEYSKAKAENDLIFVGLIGMIDPPRHEAVLAVQKCKLAGIKPVMITGDHKITAKAIAEEIGIYDKNDIVLTGNDLDNMSESKLAEIAENVTVYARVTPKHKHTIVKVLKSLGHVVAMTGDGVNDAPAVKEADIGVSMGVTGTDVTKEASAMILMDDNFATIVAAIEEGRVIYNNIRKFIRYLLSCNIGEVLTMFLGMLAGLPIPLLPIQILWVNLVTDGLPAIALGFDPPEKDIMMMPPREEKESIFSHGLLSLILFRGTIIGLSTLAVFVSMLHFTGSIERARTGAFMTLVLTQLIHVFECKSEKKSIFEIPIFNNFKLILSVLISLAMILGVVYIPSLQNVFKTVALTLNDWAIVGGLSAIGPVIASFFRPNRRKSKKLNKKIA